MRFFGCGQHVFDISDPVVVQLLNALFVALSGSIHFSFGGFAECRKVFFQRGNDVGKGIQTNRVFQLVVPVGFSTEIIAILLQQCGILFGLAAIEPYDSVEVFELPFAPFVEPAVHNGIVIPGVDKQNLAADGFALGLIEKPQRTRQRLGIEEVVADGDHHVHVACLDKFLTNVFVLPLTVRCGGRHNETRTTVLVQIRVEIRDPQIIGIPNFFILVYAWQTKRKSAGTLAGFGFDFIYVERRIRHDVITTAVQIVRVMVECVRLVAGFDNARQPVNRHVHQAELGVVFHLFLPVEGHSAVGVHTGDIHEIATLDKHPAASARAIEKNPLFGLQNVDDHLYK